MKNMGQYIAHAPERLRTRAQANLVDGAEEWNKVAKVVLGVQASGPHDHAGAGEPPKRHTGKLQNQTRAVAAAAKLEIVILTTNVGKFQEDGTSRNRPHPWLNRINKAARAAMIAALRKPAKTSVYQ
jgi:hypothetical protein